MKNHPQQIEGLMCDVADMNSHIQAKREQLNIIEAAAQIEIYTAKDADGKLLFSNDNLRKANYTSLIAENKEYCEISHSLTTIERERLYHLAKIERLKLEFRLFLLDRETEIKTLIV